MQSLRARRGTTEGGCIFAKASELGLELGLLLLGLLVDLLDLGLGGLDLVGHLPTAWHRVVGSSPNLLDELFVVVDRRRRRRSLRLLLGDSEAVLLVLVLAPVLFVPLVVILLLPLGLLLGTSSYIGRPTTKVVAYGPAELGLLPLEVGQVVLILCGNSPPPVWLSLLLGSATNISLSWP